MKVKFLILIATCFLLSCNKSEPTPINEEEVITTLTATLRPQGGGTTITLRSQDLDGDGPNEPVVTVSDSLSTNKTYDGTIELLNETESPAENITTEVRAEGLEHQFFFTVTNSVVTTAYSDSDRDTDNNPIGILFTLTTTGAKTGTLTITLRHQPNKAAAGVSDGNIANAGGDADIEVTFPIVVK